MNVIDQAADLIADRLGFGAPTELIQLIRIQLQKMYALGALDQRGRFEKLEGRLRELEERNADLIRERNSLLRLIRNSDLPCRK